MSTDPFRGLDSRPTGFGTCGGCPYRDAGSVEICYPCARQTMRALPASRCWVCDWELAKAGQPCKNPVCQWGDRHFDWNAAIAIRDGDWNMPSAPSRDALADRWMARSRW